MPIKAHLKTTAENRELERAAAFSERICRAITHANLSERKLAATSGVGARFLRKYLGGTEQPPPYEIVAIANACGVDARWLALGSASPAAAIAIGHLGGAHVVRALSGQVAQVDVVKVVAMIVSRLTLMPQPDFGPGVCRYCLCVTQIACEGGCEWIDDELTICSACLDPERTSG